MTLSSHDMRLNLTVQRTGASRFAQGQSERHQRLAPVADRCAVPLRQSQVPEKGSVYGKRHSAYSNRERVALSLQQPTGRRTNGFGSDLAVRLTSSAKSSSKTLLKSSFICPPWPWLQFA